MDYALRLQRLRALLEPIPCDALFIDHPAHLFYLTGLELSVGKLLVTQREACLIVDGRYAERSTQQTLYPVQILKESLLEELIPVFEIHQLGFDRDTAAYRDFELLTRLTETLKRQTYSLEITPLASPVQQLRMIKDPEEIDCLREAARLGYQGYEFLVSLLEEGVTETALAFELECFWKKKGASRFAFDPIIAFGANSSMPHYRAGQTQLRLHSPVLIDIGVVLKHYHSDMTRVIFFGSSPRLMQEIYAIVEEAKARAIALCRPGILIGELDRVAREWITLKGYGDHFMHSLGHGIGLETHEPPTIRHVGIHSMMPLQAGMTLTIEPGIYLPGVGGVRLEDTVLITENGCENL